MMLKLAVPKLLKHKKSPLRGFLLLLYVLLNYCSPLAINQKLIHQLGNFNRGFYKVYE